MRQSTPLRAQPSDLRPGRHDALTRTLHWVFAIGILYASVVGYALNLIPKGPTHDALSHLNMSLATILIFLFPLRVWWRLVRDQPAPPAEIDDKARRLAHLVQTTIYAAILVVLASGYLMVPHGYRLFDLVAIPTPFEDGVITDLFFVIHRASCAVLSGLIGLHLAGVFLHTVMRPTGLLRRML